MRAAAARRVLRVRAGDLEAAVAPAAGGKLVSLRSLASGREFLFQDPGPHRVGAGYADHDLGGQDECFPTVGASAGRWGRDHGLLWDTPWRVQRAGSGLRLTALRPHGLAVRFERTLAPRGPGRLRLTYCIRNLGAAPLPFLYSAHPVLAVDPNTELVLAGLRTLRVLGHNRVLAAGRRQSWPCARLRSGGRLGLARGLHPGLGLAGKWFARARDAAAVGVVRDRERLTLDWDRRALPWLGVWLCLGVPVRSGAPPAAWMCAAFEPCTHPADVLSELRRPGVLAPGGVFDFWLEWRLTRAPARTGRTA